MRRSLEQIPRTDGLFEPTKSWFPVKNSQIFETIEMSLGKPVREAHFANRQRDYFEGFLNFDFGLKDYEYQVYYRNDLTKREGLRLAHGLSVFVCSNGCVFADYQAKARHTHKAIPALLASIKDSFLAKSEELFNQKASQIDQLKTQLISDNESKALLFDLIQSKAISPNMANDIYKEANNPSYEEWTEFVGTKFGLYMAGTHLAKAIKSTERKHRAILLLNQVIGLN